MGIYLTENEIQGFYEEFSTPENVIRHCRAVAHVAVTVAEALNEHGYDLDIDMIRGAALVHDAARTKARHWDVVADRLVDMGHYEESIIVRNHMMGTGYSPIESVNEMDMIWIGDRTVKEDEYVGIDERFEYIAEKARKMGADEKHLEQIEGSKQEMQNLLDAIGEVIGQSVDSLLRD